MMKVYGTTMDDMLRKQQPNEMSNEINRMVLSFNNEN
jgi:hypothetical protein